MATRKMQHARRMMTQNEITQHVPPFRSRGRERLKQKIAKRINKQKEKEGPCLKMLK